MESGKLFCEINIHLHPPNYETIPSSYYYDRYYGNLLKFQFLTNHKLYFEAEEWRNTYLNNVPKYSLFIC